MDQTTLPCVCTKGLACPDDLPLLPEFTPKFDIGEHGHPRAPLTCRDCGEVWARLSYVVIYDRILDALDCSECGKALAIKDGEWGML